MGNEETNLVNDPSHEDRLQEMLTQLKSVVDYPSVANNVAQYNYDSMVYWTNKTKEWQNEMGKANLRWHKSWSHNPKAAAEAVEEFLARPPQVEVCRSERVWPPPAPDSLLV